VFTTCQQRSLSLIHLSELEKSCIDENFTTEEMQGEIQALKFTLNKLGEDL
jgi:hypothetical protein